jgi:hypothetical protein
MYVVVLITMLTRAVNHPDHCYNCFAYVNAQVGFCAFVLSTVLDLFQRITRNFKYTGALSLTSS